MAHRYRLDPAARLGYVRFTGTVKGPEVIQALEALHADPDWSPAMDVIWDGSGIRKLVVLPGHVEQVAVRMNAIRADAAPGKDLLVAVREVDYVVARLYVRLTRHLHQVVLLYRSLDEALYHLGRTDLPEALEAVRAKA